MDLVVAAAEDEAVVAVVDTVAMVAEAAAAGRWLSTASTPQM